MSADPENEYFSDGMTEELINALTKVEGLRVAVARTSAFAFKGENVDVREIGQQAQRRGGAGGQRAPGRQPAADDGPARSTQPTATTSGPRRYDRGIADVFAVQDELSRAITASLKVALPKRTSSWSPHGKLRCLQLLLEGPLHPKPAHHRRIPARRSSSSSRHWLRTRPTPYRMPASHTPTPCSASIGTAACLPGSDAAGHGVPLPARWSWIRIWWRRIPLWA